MATHFQNINKIVQVAVSDCREFCDDTLPDFIHDGESYDDVRNDLDDVIADNYKDSVPHDNKYLDLYSAVYYACYDQYVELVE